MNSVDVNENISSLANQLDNVKENSVESPTISSPIVKHEGAVFENIIHSSPLSSSADTFHPSIIAVKSSDLAYKNVNIASSEAEIIFNNAVGNHPPFVPSSADCCLSTDNTVQSPVLVDKNVCLPSSDDEINSNKAEVECLKSENSNLFIEFQNEKSDMLPTFIHKTDNVNGSINDQNSTFVPSVNNNLLNSPSKAGDICLETPETCIVSPCPEMPCCDESPSKPNDDFQNLSSSQNLKIDLPAILRKNLSTGSEMSMSPVCISDVSYSAQLGNTTMDDLVACVSRVKLNDSMVETCETIKENSNVFYNAFKSNDDSLQDDFFNKSNTVEILGESVNKNADELPEKELKESSLNVFNSDMCIVDNEKVVQNMSISFSNSDDAKVLVENVIGSTNNNIESSVQQIENLNENYNDTHLVIGQSIQKEGPLIPVDCKQVELESLTDSIERNENCASEVTNVLNTDEEQSMQGCSSILTVVLVDATEDLAGISSKTSSFHDLAEDTSTQSLQNENIACEEFFESSSLPVILDDFSDLQQSEAVLPDEIIKNVDDFQFKVPNSVVKKADEFTDAVEFFKDPSAMQFLEKAGSATGSDSDIPRSSLYVKFDPLHLKYELQKQNAALDDSDKTSSKNSESPEVQQNKGITACIRESLGNLLSFDSPKKLPQSKTPIIKEEPTEMYTEEELQQKLQLHELTLQDVFLKKQFDMENKLNVKSIEVEKFNSVVKALKTVVEECLLLPRELSDENKKLKEENELLQVEVNKTKDDLKVVTEDLQSVENTFADFHKRYEQCKGMLKTYKENEECFKRDIVDLKKQLVEQEEKYQLLQGRAEEAIDKVNSELSATTKTADVQMAVLKAQLKKTELKNETQARDLEHVRSENDQLKEMYDELVAKFSAS